MKILKIRTLTEYKMLERNFEINFLTKTRIDKNSTNADLIELNDEFYYPIETVFIGKNSSGKTTTLELIDIAGTLLREGRIPIKKIPTSDSFGIEVMFYKDKHIYSYSGLFIKDVTKNSNYLLIKSEKLRIASLTKSTKKDLSNLNFLRVDGFLENIGGDTSFLPKFSSKESRAIDVINFVNANTSTFAFLYKILDKEVFNSLVHLFDDSIEYIKPASSENLLDNTYEFKRYSDKKPVLVDAYTLENNLSRGTIKGICLFGIALITFMLGGTLMIDEIESSFNRNLVENLILMFNDSTINKNKGTIIYSTHYAELLDIGSRCDNVNVLHREGSHITLKNMHVDYDTRTDMLKSSQFNQNTFDTLLNYDRLMDLKRAVRGAK